MNLENICSKYDLDTTLCFLGHDLENIVLPGCFDGLEWIARNLVALVPSGKARKMIEDASSVITLRDIEGLDQRQREVAFAVYTFLLHVYVRGRWKDESAVDTLPLNFSKQLTMLADFLGCKPIGTYASTVTFNWRFLKREIKGQIEKVELSDMKMQYLFTGSVDEAWFYLVSAAVDTLSRQVLMLACAAVTSPDVFEWEPVIELINESTRLLKLMYEENLPEYFYEKVRKFMSGWKNDPVLPNGLCYTFPDGHQEWLMLSGASAAQSPTVQLFDILLGIEHHSARNGTTGVGGAGEFLKEMRLYMPRNHRECLECFEQELCRVRSSLQRRPNYDKAVAAMQTFRRTHLSMVQNYITRFGKDAKGTGGSNPVLLLNQLIEDTNTKPLIDDTTTHKLIDDTTTHKLIDDSTTRK